MVIASLRREGGELAAALAPSADGERGRPGGGERGGILATASARVPSAVARVRAALSHSLRSLTRRCSSQLKQRLQVLQERLHEEEKFTYVVVKGYIGGVENVYEETMEVPMAKQWCNSQPTCSGFSYFGDEQPDDEVTVTFKGMTTAGERLRVEPDQTMVSYLKETTSKFGALGDAAMQASGDSHVLIAQTITFESLALALALALVCAFGCRRRCRRTRAGDGDALLPTIA